MAEILPKTPKRYDSDVLEACKSICGGKPVDVPIVPETQSKDAFCWFNVEEKVARDGGEPAYGWLVVVYKERWIKAIPHAVWKSPEGTLVDITPPQLSSLNSERTLFLHDEQLNPFFTNIHEKGRPRPSERTFPFLVRKLWPLVGQKCREADLLRLAKKQDEAAAVLTELERELNTAMRR